MGRNPRGGTIELIVALEAPSKGVSRVLESNLWLRLGSKGAKSNPQGGGASIGEKRPNPLGESPRGDTIRGIVARKVPKKGVSRVLVEILWDGPSSKGAECKPVRGGALIVRLRPNPLGLNPRGDAKLRIAALGTTGEVVPWDLVWWEKYSRGSKRAGPELSLKMRIQG